MGKNLFSVPIFFIVFRETLEASIIVSVLLSIVEQLVLKFSLAPPAPASEPSLASDEKDRAEEPDAATAPAPGWERALVRRLRWQIFAGALCGFLLALAIGAAFIAVWFTKAADLWGKAEEIWEGSFDIIAALIIFAMGVTMLRMDRAKAKWRAKLLRAFEGKAVDRQTRSGKFVLFILPFVTVLREGMEAVVFVGGVSLGQPATSIPLATLCGLLCGIVCGYLIYSFASRSTLTVFLIVITNLLLLIGAGLFSKAVGAFQTHAFNTLVGADVAEAGDGPGSYDVRGNVWHLDCCSPENKFDGEGWTIFGAIFGWTNSATVGTVLAYVFYWLAVVAALVYMKFKEGRTTLMGRESAAGARLRAMRERKGAAVPRDEVEVAPREEAAPRDEVA